MLEFFLDKGANTPVDDLGNLELGERLQALAHVVDLDRLSMGIDAGLGLAEDRFLVQLSAEPAADARGDVDGIDGLPGLVQKPLPGRVDGDEQAGLAQ